MNRVYHHYTKWEDWRAGMYRSHDGDPSPGVVAAALLLADADRLRVEMSRVVTVWIHATEQNLTNLGQNRRAWLGQAACCLHSAIPGVLTRQAWWTLTLIQQVRANQSADSVIDEWEKRHTAQGRFRLGGDDA